MNTNTTTNHSRLTLVSALSDGKPSIVAEVLIKQDRTLEEVISFNKVLKSAVSIAKRMIREEEQEKNKKERLAKEQAEKRAKEERIVLQHAKKGIELAKKTFIATLIAGGTDKELAEQLAEKEFSNLYPMGKVTINYRGKVFETAVKGKASDDLKEVMKATGWSRKQIIEHFAVQA